MDLASQPENHDAYPKEAARVLSEAHGLDVSRFDGTFLAKSLEKRRAAVSMESPREYLGLLAADPAEARLLFQSLRIGHSDFFREPLAMALLETAILPMLVKDADNSQEIRVWSAGCAEGQEPWSVAILLEELSAACGNPFPYRVIATDIYPEALEKARRGVYDESAVRNLRLRHLDRYFVRQGQSFSVVPALRGHVDFSEYDLLDAHAAGPPAGIFGDFDLVLCCNLLFYYQPGIQKTILDRVRRSLRTGGYLVTGATERGIVEKAGGFRGVAAPAPVYQKVMRMRA
ncbi:MAG: hypothetical protein H3C30_03720 [Candidatus Hydrogenedentes bacterium]|nr:hypothetical protein [Candidatus Hydrogenedentota bacterium]